MYYVSNLFIGEKINSLKNFLHASLNLSEN